MCKSMTKLVIITHFMTLFSKYNMLGLFTDLELAKIYMYNTTNKVIAKPRANQIFPSTRLVKICVPSRTLSDVKQ